MKKYNSNLSSHLKVNSTCFKVFYLPCDKTNRGNFLNTTVKRGKVFECLQRITFFWNTLNTIQKNSVLTANRLFTSCPKPLFQSEANWEAIDMKMIFIQKTCFHKKAFALSLVLKVREMANWLTSHADVPGASSRVSSGRERNTWQLGFCTLC